MISVNQENKYSETVDIQKQGFKEGLLNSYQKRIDVLKKLLEIIRNHETEIQEALFKDLHKGKFESWGVEFGVIEQELLHSIRNLKGWMRPKHVRTPLFHFRSKSREIPVPYGNTINIAPWNYPFLLALRPCVGAIAAGNTMIIKPSEHAIHTSRILEKIINSNFNPAILHVVSTDANGSKELLDAGYDFIFFTGGSFVGQKVYEAAAKKLTPVVLELGGKNPCIIDRKVNLKVAINRITWGKFSNAGQTCVSPDYILVHEDIWDDFTSGVKKTINSFYGDDPSKSKDYGRIINLNHFNRLAGLIENANIIYGGGTQKDDLYISPTVVEVTDKSDLLLQEEVFGPIMVLIKYASTEELSQYTSMHPNPLVAYFFSKNPSFVKQLMPTIDSGDVVVNDVVLHFGHMFLKIGGKGSSGIGKYQGKHTFDVFSHTKSYFEKRFTPDISLRYPPYSEKSNSIFKWLFKATFKR